MTQAGFARVKQVLAEVRGLQGRALSERLDVLCADDAELREEVASLLPHCESDDDRLEAPGERRALLGQLFDGDSGSLAPAPASPDGPAPGSSAAPATDATTAVPRLEGPLRPGARLGHFELGERLGAGGMGVVYAAVQDAPRRSVALKLLPGGPASRSLVERFEHEIEVLGRLDHPGIAALYEAGVVETDDGPRPWFAMPLVHGRPLDDWVRRRTLSPVEVVNLFIDVCDAVHHAHARGVVHRDLKPGNVLVDEDGRPTVLDFGVARLTDAHTQLSSLHTEPGQLIGTLPYMSPEQVGGRADAVDARSDVYALGAMLYEALVGRLPVATEGLSVPAAAVCIREQDATRLGDFDTDLRGDLEVLVDTCLSKEPERRYANAGDLAADLRRFRDQRQLVARPLSRWERARRFVSRHRALSLGTAVALLSLSVSLGVSLHHVARSDRDRDLALLEADRSRLSGAAAALGAHDPLTAATLLAEVSADGRSWEWAHLRQQLDTVSRWLTCVEDPLDATLVDDGDVLLMVGASGRLTWRRVADDDLLGSVQLPGPLQLASLSADGSRLVGTPVDDPRRMVCWDTAGGRPVADLETEEDVRTLSTDEHGDRVLWLGLERAPRLWTPGAPEGLTDLRRPQDERWAGTLLRADRYALLGVAGHLEFGRIDRFLDPGAAHVGRVSNERIQGHALSGDGRQLAVAGSNKAIAVFDVDSGERLATLKGHARVPTALAFVEGGRRLVSTGLDGTLRWWDVATREVDVWAGGGGPTGALLVHPDRSSVVGWGPDARAAVWQPDGQRERSVLRGHERYVYALDITPDGRALVSASWDGTLRWWDLPGGRAAGVVPVGGRAQHVAATADGTAALVWSAGRLTSWPRDGGAHRTQADELFMLSGFALWSEARVLLGTRVVGEPHPPAWLDLTTGELVDALDAGDRHVTALSWNGPRTALATGALDGRIDLWTLPDGAHRRSLPGHAERVNDLAVSPTAPLLASAGWDERALIQHLERDEVTELPGHASRVHALAWTPDGERLATGSDDGVVRLFDPRDGALVAQLRGHEDYVHDLVFAPDGSLLASASGDGTVRLWHTRPISETSTQAGPGR